jgi:hypothetical protein
MGKLTSRSASVFPTSLASSHSKNSGIALPVFLGILCSASTFAQSAANFATDTLTPAAPISQEEKMPKPARQEAGPVNVTPSRQVATAELESYITSLSSVFMARSRAFDPFGQTQDPDAKPIIKAPVAGAVRRIAPILATPFPEIIQKIVVTTIMPGEKRFLVGTKSFKQGDQIPLLFRGKPIRTQVTEVTSRQITFRNLDNGEIATRKLDMLPVGMTPGSHGISAPGMSQDRPNAPIELDTGDSSP